MKILTTISMALLIFTGCSAVDGTLDSAKKTTEVKKDKYLTSAIKPENEIAPKGIDQKIGQMLMVGFFGTTAEQGSQICNDIKNYNLGGVILFDYNPVNKNKPKNIKDKVQLTKLTKQLQRCSHDGKLLIAVDQEGGKVQRLKTKYGFYGKFPSAKEVSQKGLDEATKVYSQMGKELHATGINFDLGPVVDLSINPKNVVINKLGRSYGKDPEKVVVYASIFMSQMHKNKVLTSIKHFPGHGSSVGDSHKGFVDVTNDWEEKELDPYTILIEKGTIDTIMVAHVFNANLDPKYPASLSKKTITDKLRHDMGYDGVVITDDLQMNAIDEQYKLRETLHLAINAGDDILLFGNQLNPRDTLSTKKLVNIIVDLVNSGEVSVDKIDHAYDRIKKLKSKHM